MIPRSYYHYIKQQMWLFTLVVLITHDTKFIVSTKLNKGE